MSTAGTGSDNNRVITPSAGATSTPILPAATDLEKLRAKLDELAEKIKKPQKDRWDKFASVSSLLSAGLVAAIGFYATNIYNHRQQVAEDQRKNQELMVSQVQTVEKFIPHLASGNESEKRAALIAISQLGNDQLAVKLAEAFSGPGATSALTTIAATASPAGAAAAGKALTDVLSYLKPRLVSVVQRGKDGPTLMAMGFLASNAGLVLAAAHSVPSKSAAIEVRFANGSIVQGTVVSKDLASGLALIKVPVSPSSVSALEPSPVEPALLTRVVALVMGPSQQFLAVVGSVEAIDVHLGQPFGGELIALSMRSYPGSSGAPVVDEQGRFLGIVVAADAEGGLTYAVPARKALELINSLSSRS